MAAEQISSFEVGLVPPGPASDTDSPYIHVGDQTHEHVHAHGGGPHRHRHAHDAGDHEHSHGPEHLLNAGNAGHGQQHVEPKLTRPE